MAEEYAGELTKLAVSKASIALGYKYANPEVVDCLADVIRHYIETLAKEGQSSIENYGRTNPGVMDFFPITEQSVSFNSEFIVISIGKIRILFV